MQTSRHELLRKGAIYPDRYMVGDEIQLKCVPLVAAKHGSFATHLFGNSNKSLSVGF
jgi:hypothetical protein